MQISHQEEDLFTRVKQNSAQRGSALDKTLQQESCIRVLPVYCGVPAGSQGEVDDHVHGDQISHRVVVCPHGAQDPLPRLETGNTKHFKTTRGHFYMLQPKTLRNISLTAMKTPLGPLKLSIQP